MFHAGGGVLNDAQPLTRYAMQRQEEIAKSFIVRGIGGVSGYVLLF
jgi:hypothetical protein